MGDTQSILCNMVAHQLWQYAKILDYIHDIVCIWLTAEYIPGKDNHLADKVVAIFMVRNTE